MRPPQLGQMSWLSASRPRYFVSSLFRLELPVRVRISFWSRKSPLHVGQTSTSTVRCWERRVSLLNGDQSFGHSLASRIFFLATDRVRRTETEETFASAWDRWNGSRELDVPRDRGDRLDVPFRLRVHQDVVQEFRLFLLRDPVEELALLAGLLPLTELFLLRDIQRLHRVLHELGPAGADLVRVVVPLHELDEEPLVVEQFAGEGLQERPEGIFVLVDRREELGPFRFEVRLQLLDVGRPEGEVLHVRLRVLLRLPRESVRERGLCVGHFVRRAHPEHDREPLPGQGIQACERRHRGLLLADSLRLVHGRISAVQEEVPQGTVRADVPAQDRLVVDLQFQERGKCCDALTVCESKPGTITLSEPDARLTEAERPA